MNRQKNFRNPKYNHGQHDKYEGAILRGPCDVKYFEDGKEKQVHLNNDGIMYKENNAYIFCMYKVEFDEKSYDKKNNTFYHNISWDYIKSLWDDKDDLEMMIIKNTNVFFRKFLDASNREGKKCARGLVKYDLQEKLHDKVYFEKALEDDFEAIYSLKNGKLEITMVEDEGDYEKAEVVVVPVFPPPVFGHVWHRHEARPRPPHEARPAPRPRPKPAPRPQPKPQPKPSERPRSPKK